MDISLWNCGKTCLATVLLKKASMYVYAMRPGWVKWTFIFLQESEPYWWTRIYKKNFDLASIDLAHWKKEQCTNNSIEHFISPAMILFGVAYKLHTSPTIKPSIFLSMLMTFTLLVWTSFKCVRKDPAGTIQWRQSFRGWRALRVTIFPFHDTTRTLKWNTSSYIFYLVISSDSIKWKGF